MTTNFNSISVDPGTNARISISDRDSLYCEDRLAQQQHQINDRIDSRWPPLMNSSANNEVTTVPSSSTYASFQAAPLAQVNENSRTQANAIPMPNSNSFSPTCVTNVKNLTQPIKVKARGDTRSTAPTGEHCQHQHYQLQNHGLDQLQYQHQLRNKQQHQQQHQRHLHNQHQQQHQQQLQNQQQDHHQNHCQQQHQHQQQQQQFQNKQQQQQQHQQRQVDLACLYPRDDHRSRVRFSQSLFVYDNFEDHDYSDSVNVNSSETINQNISRVNDENNDCELFMLNRARCCWYSREELKLIKNERKEIVRSLRRVNFDVRSIDPSVHELRGFEAYLSPDIMGTTQRKRKEALQTVLNEQDRQRQPAGGKRNVERLQLASLRVTKWFRTRAFEIAEKDAKEAQELYLNHPEVLRVVNFLRSKGKNKNDSFHQQRDIAEQDGSTLYESFNESVGLMDIDDDDTGDGSGNDSSLLFWANSSWTKDLMNE